MLANYLATLRHRRWQPGQLDCGVFMADWVVALCGRDPIADVRGTYTTEKQFLRIVRREGGFEVAWASRLARVGFRETAAPAAGDIVTVLAPFARSQDRHHCAGRGRYHRIQPGLCLMSWFSGVTGPASSVDGDFALFNGATGKIIKDSSVAIATAAQFKAGTANKIVDSAVLANVPSFSVHKNGTDQTGVGSAAFTQVTFGTELYDIGSYFASNAWAPPAGKVHLCAGVAFSGTISAGANCQIAIFKNGAAHLQIPCNPFTNAGGASVGIDDVANGSDVYTVFAYVTTSSGTATILGNTAQTRFSGHWISP
jgi:hypothetical protein